MERLRTSCQFEFQLNFPHCSNNGSFKIIFHNVQSLRKNIEFVRRSVIYRHCAVVLLCETWLTSDDQSADLMLEDFRLFRFDYLTPHDTRPHAGIAIYVHEAYQTDATVEPEIHFGVQFGQFVFKGIRCLLVHRRPSSTNVPNFRRALRLILSSFNPTIIVGDFNERVNSADHWLISLFSDLGYSQKIQSATTDDNTTLDLVFSLTSCETAILESAFSFHKPLYVALPFPFDEEI